MKFRIISGYYLPKQKNSKQDLKVNFFGVKENNEIGVISIRGTRPRFWVDVYPDMIKHKEEIIEIKKTGGSPSGKDLWMVVYEHPKQTYKLRNYFKKTYQADVPYIEAVRLYYKIPNIIEIEDKILFAIDEIRGDSGEF